MQGTTSAPLPLTQIGGRHRAVQASDGTWTIFGVPVFAAFKDVRHKAKDGKPVEYTVQFLRKVVSRHQMRLRDGYVAPVHVHHHGDQRGTRRIGGIVPRRIERRPYDGKPLDFLVADLVGIHPDDFSRIQRQEFPYPSVEIDPKEPEILSLALLSDEAPFFRHMLSIGEAIVQRLTRESAPAIAFRALPAGHARVLFSFSGGRRLDDKSKPAAVETLAAAPALDPALLDAIAQIVQAQIAEALGQQGESKPEETGPVEMDSFGHTDRNFAAGATQALQDDIKHMRAELTTLRQEREAEQAIQHAADKIETAGAQVDKAKLRHYMAQGGKSYLDGYVEAMLATHVSTPHQWTGEFDAPRTDTPEVAKFATHGPDQLARARQLAHEYEVAPPSVRHYCSLAQYLANNVNPDAALICGATEEAN
jgi:hypothetical protein